MTPEVKFRFVVRDKGKKIVSINADDGVEYGEGVSPEDAIRSIVEKTSERIDELYKEAKKLWEDGEAARTTLKEIVALKEKPGDPSTPDYYHGIWDCAEIAEKALTQ